MPRKFQFDDPTFDDLPQTGGGVPFDPVDELPVTNIAKVLKAHTARLMAIPGVKSVGEGQGPVGNPAIEVGIANAGVVKSVPKKVGGIDVVTRVVGEVEAYGQPAGPE